MIHTQRRRTNYWEPIYNPSQNDLTKRTLEKTDFDTETGWKESILELKAFLDSNSKYNKLTFSTVDFSGTLEPEKTKSITFNNCTFENVSFSGTIFKNVKFQKCIFDKTTFSLSTFSNCEFRDCTYKDIGISGNTTVFNDCYIDSKKLLGNVFLNQNKDFLKEKNTTPLYQKYRHIKTKSVIARKIMSMPPVINDLSMLIKSISVARNYETKASILGNMNHIMTESSYSKIPYIVSFLFPILELIIINIFGWLTGWGYKIGKTTFIGIIGIIMFSFVYNYCLFEEYLYIENLLRSFEYWFLIGYTKYSFECLDIYTQLIIFLNAFFGSLWFASLIPVIFNKMSRDDK